MELGISDLKADMDELKVDIRKLEEKILVFEQNPHFQNEDARYRRLVEEKQLLLTHLCDLRTNMYSRIALRPTPPPTSSNGNSYDQPATKRLKTNHKRGWSDFASEQDNYNPSTEIEYYVDRNEIKFENGDESSHVVALNSLPALPPSVPHSAPNLQVVPPPSQQQLPIPAPNSSFTNPPSNYYPSPAQKNQFPHNIPPVPQQTAQVPPPQPQPPQQQSTGSDNVNNVPQNQPIPNLQLEEYLETKMKLAQIMRDFNDKKICFIAIDNSRIYVQQYQQISSRVKNGEDIANFLKGKVVMFVTAIDKKKRSITETKLFIPDFEFTKY